MSQRPETATTDYLRLLAELVERAKRRTYQLMHVQPGAAVLDVGCGPAIDTLALAELVGPHGKVAGVDTHQDHVDSANDNARAAGLADRVVHRVADATALPYANGEFDAVRSERVFQHIPNCAAALAEMARVTKPGGWVVVLDTDWNTESYAIGDHDAGLYDIERRLVRYRAERFMVNGSVGRELLRQFTVQGLRELHVELVPHFLTDYALTRSVGFLDEVEAAALRDDAVFDSEVERWHARLSELDRRGCFFWQANQVMIAGRK